MEVFTVLPEGVAPVSMETFKRFPWSFLPTVLRGVTDRTVCLWRVFLDGGHVSEFRKVDPWTVGRVWNPNRGWV